MFFALLPLEFDGIETKSVVVVNKHKSKDIKFTEGNELSGPTVSINISVFNVFFYILFSLMEFFLINLFDDNSFAVNVIV